MHSTSSLRDYRRWYLSGVRVPNSILPDLLVLQNVEITMFEGASLPLNNTKVVTVLGLLDGAAERGKLSGIHTLVEATSGNTGKVLAAAASEFGVCNVVQVMEPDVPYGKSFPGIAFGAGMLPPETGLSTIETARKLGLQDGWLNLDQYSNPDGLDLHRLFTGPHIVEALGEVPGMFVASIGTASTIGGIGQFLLAEGPCMVVGVLLEDFDELPGMRDERGMKHIQLPWRTYFRVLEKVLAKESYYASLCLSRATGHSFGPTSGATFLKAVHAAMRLAKEGGLDAIRNKRTGKVVIAGLGPDGFELYHDRYNANVHRDHSKPGVLPLPWQVLPQRYCSYVL